MLVAGGFIRPQGTGAANFASDVDWTRDTTYWILAEIRMVTMATRTETYTQMLANLALAAPLLCRRRVS